MGFEMLGPLLGMATSLFGGNKDKGAKQQYNAELAQIRLQRQEDASALALQKAQMASAPSEQRRQEQLLMLVGIGGGALLLSGLLILGASKK